MEEIEVYNEVFEFWVPGVGLTGERANMVGRAKGVLTLVCVKEALIFLPNRVGRGTLQPDYYLFFKWQRSIDLAALEYDVSLSPSVLQ